MPSRRGKRPAIQTIDVSLALKTRLKNESRGVQLNAPTIEMEVSEECPDCLIHLI